MLLIFIISFLNAVCKGSSVLYIFFTIDTTIIYSLLSPWYISLTCAIESYNEIIFWKEWWRVYKNIGRYDSCLWHKIIIFWIIIQNPENWIRFAEVFNYNKTLNAYHLFKTARIVLKKVLKIVLKIIYFSN